MCQALQPVLLFQPTPPACLACGSRTVSARSPAQPQAGCLSRPPCCAAASTLGVVRYASSHLTLALQTPFHFTPSPLQLPGLVEKRTRARKTEEASDEEFRTKYNPDDLPKDFNWELYQKLNKDLRDGGFDSQVRAGHACAWSRWMCARHGGPCRSSWTGDEGVCRHGVWCRSAMNLMQPLQGMPLQRAVALQVMA